MGKHVQEMDGRELYLLGTIPPKKYCVKQFYFVAILVGKQLYRLSNVLQQKDPASKVLGHQNSRLNWLCKQNRDICIIKNINKQSFEFIEFILFVRIKFHKL